MAQSQGIRKFSYPTQQPIPISVYRELLRLPSQQTDVQQIAFTGCKPGANPQSRYAPKVAEPHGYERALAGPYHKLNGKNALSLRRQATFAGVIVTLRVV